MSADVVLQDLTPDMLPLHPGLFDGHCFETSLLRRFPLPLSERHRRFSKFRPFSHRASGDIKLREAPSGPLLVPRAGSMLMSLSMLKRLTSPASNY